MDRRTPRVVDLSVLLDDADLRRRFGAVTLDRARDYLDSGRVVSVSHQPDEQGDLDIRGLVAGTARASYQAYVAVGSADRGLWVYTRCSCPVGDGCKHGLALLLAVRAEHEREAEASGSARWERRLGRVLDELDVGVAASDRARPLALRVDLRGPGGRATRWPPADADPRESRGSLRIRPLQQGARDGWVRAGVSWHDVPHLAGRGAHRAEHAAALSELLAVYRAASGQTYVGSESHLSLAAMEGGLWAALDRAVRAGVRLVPGDGLESVELVGAVTVELDVAAGADTLHLVPGVRHDGGWWSAADLEVLGDEGRGVALWRLGGGGGPGGPGEDGRHDRGRGGDEPVWRVVLAPLRRPAGPEVRRLLRTADDLRVPLDDRHDLVADYLPRLHRHLPVRSSDGSVELPVPAEPRLALEVTWISVEEVHVRWSWRYAVGGRDRVYALDAEHGLGGVRRPDLEAELLAALPLDAEAVPRLCRHGVRADGVEPARSLRGTAAIGFAVDVLPGLLRLAAAGDLELEQVGVRPDYREAGQAPVVRFAPRPDTRSTPDAGPDGAAEPATDAADEDPGSEDSAGPFPRSPDARTDWLDLEVTISVDGESLALGALLAALTLGQERVILASGLHLAVDRPEFARLAELVTAAGDIVEQPADGVRVGRADLGLWDELAEIGLVDAQAARWVEAARALRGSASLPAVDPVGLEANLRAYQRDGFRWLAFLWRAGLGGILADDMGLGKTVQTLALAAYARHHGAGPFLVVAPTSVVSTWVHEAAVFTPGLRVVAVSESQARRGRSVAALRADADVVVTSYTLHRLEAEAYAEQPWGGLVLDEAQVVKNHQGKTYQAVRRVDAGFRVALTGTPMENRLIELWSLLSIVAPGLYPWPQHFRDTVADPVERLGDATALARFRRRIRPFVLRRTKEVVAADLPAKQEQVVDVRLSRAHREVYETHLQRERQTVLGLVGDFDRHRIAIFRSLTRLRQLALDPGLVDERHDRIGSAKVDLLLDHLSEIAAEGHRALVFSQFTSFLGRVRRRLDAEGIASDYLDGATRHRGEVVDSFRAGDAPVFLISLKAGGVGLTLTEADYVFVLDPWWNPAVEAQAVDRAHRIGQTRPVHVYRLVAQGTVEQKVMELKARKAALFARVVDGGEAALSGIDADDVRALLAD